MRKYMIYLDGLCHAIVYSKAEARRIYNRDYLDAKVELNVYCGGSLVAHWSGQERLGWSAL